MSNFVVCMLVANIYIAAGFVRLKSRPLVLHGFAVFWIGMACLAKYLGE